MAKPTKSPSAPASAVSAAQWFSQGISAHADVARFAFNLKVRAVEVGWYFMQAKLASKHGDFGDLVAASSAQISLRTVQSYMAFCEDVLVSVIATQRKLTDKEVRELELTDKQRSDTKLLEAGRDVVVHSTMGLVDLMRQLGQFRKLGEYDANRHALEKARKAVGLTEQIEFDFTVASAGLRTLSAIADCAQDKLPPPAQLAELEQKLEAALTAVRSRRKAVITLPTIPAEPTQEGAASPATDPQ